MQFWPSVLQRDARSTSMHSMNSRRTPAAISYSISIASLLFYYIGDSSPIDIRYKYHERYKVLCLDFFSATAAVTLVVIGVVIGLWLWFGCCSTVIKWPIQLDTHDSYNFPLLISIREKCRQAHCATAFAHYAWHMVIEKNNCYMHRTALLLFRQLIIVRDERSFISLTSLRVFTAIGRSLKPSKHRTNRVYTVHWRIW